MPYNNYQFSNVLVTGGAGFIGANFIHWLNKHYSKVKIVNLDALTYAANPGNLATITSPNYTFIHGNITDLVTVKNVLEHYEIDTIVHFAAESHVDRSIAEPAQFIQTNILGTFILLEAAREVWINQNKWNGSQCRFHHVSTDEVFGSLNNEAPAFTEVTPYAPNSPYSASKAGSDHLVRAYFHTYNLPVTISNCSNNYGPYQHTEKLIPTIIRACINQEKIPIYGNGLNIRDWLYVEDHCQALALILEKGDLGETYNIGGDCELTNLALTQKICTLMDKRFPQTKPYQSLIEFVKDRPAHDWRYAINFSKLNNKLGWNPKVNIDEGLEKTVRFYCE